MFTVICLMLSGAVVGFLLRRWRMPFVSRVVTALVWVLLFLLGVEVGGNPRVVLVWVLLFLLGVEVGGNPRVVGSLATLGVEALVLALAGVAGCAVACKIIFKDKNAR